MRLLLPAMATPKGRRRGVDHERKGAIAPSRGRSRPCACMHSSGSTGRRPPRRAKRTARSGGPKRNVTAARRWELVRGAAWRWLARSTALVPRVDTSAWRRRRSGEDGALVRRELLVGLRDAHLDLPRAAFLLARREASAPSASSVRRSPASRMEQTYQEGNHGEGVDELVALRTP